MPLGIAHPVGRKGNISNRQHSMSCVSFSCVSGLNSNSSIVSP